MQHRLTQRLINNQVLEDEDRLALERLDPKARYFAAREAVMAHGARPGGVQWVEQGWAFRRRRLENGVSVVFNFVLPGELIDPAVLTGVPSDHDVVALNEVRTLEVPVAGLRAVMSRHPRVSEALLHGAVQDGARLRDQITHLGRSGALKRVAFFFASLAERQATADPDGSGALGAIFGHDIIADATGLSRVHVSRTLKQLRAMGLIDLDGRRWRILDAARLRELTLNATV
ncbi:MAG: Crp/Fnr family transcriptional regulator [Oceanicaulis sp.]